MRFRRDTFRSAAQPVWGQPHDAGEFPFATSDLAVDVAIVGAGFSGLWTAFHLAQLDANLDIAVLDAATPGFGASGRNGGWCSALMPMSLEKISAASCRADAVRMQRAMFDTVDDVGAFVTRSGVDCGWNKGGHLHSATNPAHLRRLRDEVSSYRNFGFDSDDLDMLTANEARSRIDATGTCGASFTPHCAALNPQALVRALVAALSDTRVTVYSRCRATSMSPHIVNFETPDGSRQITARWVVRATEGFTRTLESHTRTLAPIYSFMIATEPLPEAVWSNIGWRSRETFADARHMVIYAQRTSDGRIAFGGRGAPYKWASGVSPSFDTNSRVHTMLERTLHELFPPTREAAITHRWGGPLGLPRDWFSSVHCDHASGLVSLGGYVGDGVAMSHLAAETAAHLITRTDSDLVRLPWVDHVSPQWEPEPLRYLGINTMLRVPALADARERRTQRSSVLLSKVIDSLIK